MNALMKQYCSYKDLKDLYGKVVLPVDQMQKNMHEFTKEHEQMKAVVCQYDQDLALKANKSSFFEVEKVIYDSQAKVKQIEAEQVRVTNDLNETIRENKNLKDSLQLLSENI